MTDGDDDELAGSQRKRLRLDDAEIRKFYDPKLAERVVAFRESDLRDKEHALVAYDFSSLDVQPDDDDDESGGPSGAPSPQPANESSDPMRNFFPDTLKKISKTFKTSFCEGETYPWLQDEKVSVEHRALIPLVLSMVFGQWCVSGGVRRLHEPCDRVNVYLPQTLSEAKTSCERGNIKVVYTSNNAAVYFESATTINDLVQEFVDCMARHGLFTASSSSYFLPAPMIGDIAFRIVDALMGDQRRPARLHGPKSVYSEYGMRQVPMPCRSLWAFGSKVMVFPEPIEPQKWNDVAAHGRDSKYLPQIKIVTPSYDDPPYIPATRWFAMDDAEEERYINMLETICGVITQYAVDIFPKYRADPDFLRQWVSDETFRILHSGNLDSFMSCIGAQYLQSVCIRYQHPSFEFRNPHLPRAYYTDDDRYYNGASDEEVRVCAMFVDVLASTLFGYQATIAGLVGVPGTNKSTLVDCLVNLVGGHQYVFHVNGNTDKFSLGDRAPMSWFLTEIGDSLDQPFPLPSDLKDKVMGKERSSENALVLNPKGIGSRVRTIFQVGGVMSRNAPYESPGASDVDRWRQLTGTSAGDPRRGRPVPPMCQSLHDGTANPCRGGRYAYTKADLETKDGRELKYILPLLFCVASMSNSIENDEFGLAGESNRVLAGLIQQYVSRTVVNVDLFMRNNLEQSPDPDDTCKLDVPDSSKQTSVTVQQMVLKSTVQKLFDKHKMKTSIPTQWPTAKMMSCHECGLVFTGFRETRMPAIAAYMKTKINPDGSAPPHTAFRYCPKTDNGERCFTMVRKELCVVGHQIRVAPRTLHAVHSVHYQPSTA